jgi:hypothetical protein
MVTVDYIGRTGNNMFQYAMARLVAAHSGLKLETLWCDDGFIEATPNPLGDVVSGGMVYLDDTSAKREDHNYGKTKLHLRGYFQQVENYNDYRDEIRKFWKLPDVCKNNDDIVMHLRLSDYWWANNISVIHPAWYRMILRSQKYSKLFIVVEPHKTNQKYLNYFKDLRPIYVSQPSKDDFNFIRSFDRIICSNSSFCWWAAFLSTARQIWTFLPWMNHKGINLARVVGAKALQGTFIRDKRLERFDWTDYWKAKTQEHYEKIGKNG